MKQKFTFKRMLSLLVVFTMLFASFAVLSVPASAVDIYWAEGDYTIADDGNMTANHAYGYVFDIAGLNAAVTEANTIFTSDETWKTTSGWLVYVVLEQVEGDVYKVVKVYDAPRQYAVGTTETWGDFVDALTETQIAMVVHSNGPRPNAAGDYSDGAAIEYANWESKVAALALAAGTEVTLAGIDLEGLTCENGTVTVQDAPYVAPHVHTPGESATCTKDQTCTECGETIVEALGHKAGTAASCKDPQTCTVCGETITAALGHKAGEWTTLTDGSQEQRCTVCGELLDTKPAPEQPPVDPEQPEQPSAGKLGDINNDNAINQYDYILAKRIHFNTVTLTFDQKTRGDVNRDGTNDQYDYILIKRHHFGTYTIGGGVNTLSAYDILAKYVLSNGTLDSDGETYRVVDYNYDESDGIAVTTSISYSVSKKTLSFSSLLKNDTGETFAIVEVSRDSDLHQVGMVNNFYNNANNDITTGYISGSEFSNSNRTIYSYSYISGDYPSLSSNYKTLMQTSIDIVLYFIANDIKGFNLGITIKDLGFANYDGSSDSQTPAPTTSSFDKVADYVTKNGTLNDDGDAYYVSDVDYTSTANVVTSIYYFPGDNEIHISQLMSLEDGDVFTTVRITEGSSTYSTSMLCNGLFSSSSLDYVTGTIYGSSFSNTNKTIYSFSYVYGGHSSYSADFKELMGTAVNKALEFAATDIAAMGVDISDLGFANY